MRDEKEERKKQARSNKQTRQSNTAHPRQSLFLEKMSCLRWDSNPRHSILQTERSTNTCIYIKQYMSVVYTCMIRGHNYNIQCTYTNYSNMYIYTIAQLILVQMHCHAHIEGY